MIDGSSIEREDGWKVGGDGPCRYKKKLHKVPSPNAFSCPYVEKVAVAGKVHGARGVITSMQ